MNQRLVGGEVDSVHARSPVGLNKSRQTLAPTQMPLQKGSRIASGNRGTGFILLPNFYVNLSYYAQTDVEKMGPDVTLRAVFFRLYITGRHESQPAYEGRMELSELAQQ